MSRQRRSRCTAWRCAPSIIVIIDQITSEGIPRRRCNRAWHRPIDIEQDEAQQVGLHLGRTRTALPVLSGDAEDAFERDDCEDRVAVV
jgi:hypothetical protein